MEKNRNVDLAAKKEHMLARSACAVLCKKKIELDILKSVYSI